jgi:hypothetical protein
VSNSRQDTIVSNLISANTADGINVNSNLNIIESNNVGTDFTGTRPLGNGGIGINLPGGFDNTIGRTSTGAGNTIAFNKNAGVEVTNGSSSATTGVAILSNAIYSNGNLGITLDNNANNSQSAPVLTNAATYQGNTYIPGDLHGAPSASYTVQFFASPVPDPSGYGQGQTFLGTMNVTTDASGNATFLANLPTTVPGGQAISATATDAKGNTSEFAGDITLIASSSPVVAANSSYNDDENYTLNVPAPGVLGTDFDIDGDPLTAILVSDPAHGSVTLNPDGSYSYTPAADYLGPDSFTYQATDGTTLSDVATLTISVNPKTYVVTSTADSGTGSLRWAINQANLASSPAPDIIDFAIPNTDPGYNASTNAWTIQPASALPAIAHATLIDGYSQPGAAANTLAQGDNAHIAIDLNGASVSTADGLLITASNSTVQGLAINQFANGIHLQGGSGETIAGNFVGTDVTGQSGSGNTHAGLWLDNSSQDTVGGTSAGVRNILSANDQGRSNIGSGNLLLTGGATDNLVQGNYIGTDTSGTSTLSVSSS